MNHVPLFYYPTRWVFVDDDPTLLECMRIAFESEYTGKIALFSEVTVCLDFLNHYQAPLSNKNFLKCSDRDEQFGVLHHLPIDFDITQLSSLITDERRFEEISVLVVDYHMPELNGFSFLKQCEFLSAYKILLTGTTEDRQVISGFNHDVIHRFVPKGDDEMERTLKQDLKKLSFSYFQKKTAHLLTCLEAENVLPLSDSVFANFFQHFCEQKNISEFYLIDKQGSFLCITREGKKILLVIHTDRSLETWMTTYATENELPADVIAAVKQRKQIPFFGLGKEAWNIPSPEWSNYFYPAHCLQGRERYFWCELEG